MAEISTKPVSDLDAAVRLLSGGTNVVIYNDLDMPSIYVRRDKGKISDVIDGGPDTIHYAFKVNGVEVPAFYMGKYLATVYKGRALSLPLQDPTAYAVELSDAGRVPSRYVLFETAKLWCEANGAGFHMATLAEYAWIALLSHKNGTMPHGNNNYGSDRNCIYEKGVGSSINVNVQKTGRTLTGSGPATWNDNWQPDGICDLNGNVYEYMCGHRTVDGELQIIPDNDAAMHIDQTSTSTLWKAILQDGTLVEPGTDGTLKWDYITQPVAGYVANRFHLNTKISYQSQGSGYAGRQYFRNLKAADGVSVPDRLKALTLMPDGNGNYGMDEVVVVNHGERILAGGGCSIPSVIGGIFQKYTCGGRNLGGNDVGFRPAFIPGI